MTALAGQRYLEVLTERDLNLLAEAASIVTGRRDGC